MPEGEAKPLLLSELVRKLVLTALAAFQNRSELFLVELQEEKNRLVELIVWVMAICFMGMMFIGVLTATVILIFPEHLRIYAAGGFCLIYLTGAVLALLNLKALLKNMPPPFAETMDEVKKDYEWLESLK